MNQVINDIDAFMQNMENLGYQLVGKIFLVKHIGEIDVNITVRGNNIEAIIGYKNNNIIDIPKQILEQTKSDITGAL